MLNIDTLNLVDSVLKRVAPLLYERNMVRRMFRKRALGDARAILENLEATDRAIDRLPLIAKASDLLKMAED